MRLRRATIENFKRFAPPGIELDFCNTALGEVADRFLVLGDNGSGKTTVLQAIAVTLALAAHKISDVGGLWWKGWMPERYFAHDNPVVQVEVELTEDEIEATQQAARRWSDVMHIGREFVLPGTSRVIKLRLEGARVRAEGGREELHQLRGRYYVATALNKINDPELRALFARLPGVFWYDQYRTVALSARDELDRQGPSTFANGIDKLDKILRSWHDTRRARGPHPTADYLGDLEQRYSAVFPGRSFAGLEPVYSGSAPTPDDNRFVLSDGKRTYALAEMSAGEQAIFPILFEFVRQQIHRSVVLIDEVDLNLHPPLAQMLLGLLPRLGEANQFLFTTHASVVSTLMSPYAIHRLQGGHLCL